MNAPTVIGLGRFLLIALFACAVASECQAFSKGYFGIDLWQFHTSRGGTNAASEYHGNPAYGSLTPTPIWPNQPSTIPPTWGVEGPGSTLGFNYSGTGAVSPAFREFTINLGQNLPLGDYHLFIKNFYRGQMDVIVGNQTFTNVPIIRFDWTDPINVSINTIADQTSIIKVRYYPNTITLNTGVAQSQNYILQGMYITSDMSERPNGYNTIVTQLASTPPTPLGPGINYIEDGSFEGGLGHGWGQPMGYRTYPVTDYVDSTTTGEGSRSLKFDLPTISAGLKYGFPLESKFYRVSPYIGGNTGNGKITYTLSYWMKASRNATSVRGRLVGLDPNLTDDAFTLTGAMVPSTVTTSWQRFSITGQLADMPGYLYGVRFTSNEDAPNPITVWVDGVQLEEGATATAWKPREAIEVGFTPAQPGNIYYDNDPQSAVVSMRFDNKNAAASTSVDYEIYNFYDQLVAKGTQAVTLGGARNISASLPLYAAKRGIYRLIVNITGATTKAEFVYSVLPPNLNLNADYDAGTLGTDASFDPRALAVLKRANFSWVLSKNYRWIRIEPTQDNFIWDDQPIIDARAAKLKVLLQLFSQDRGAFAQANMPAGYPTGATWPTSQRAAYLVDWNDYVSRTVNRYKTWCKHWELENEPNAGFQSQDYAEILKQSYGTIKTADSSATVAGFSGGGFSQSWYDAVFNTMGSANYFDAVSVHLYAGDATLFTSFKNWVTGHGNKPSWNTETGLTCNHLFTTLPTYNSVTYSNDRLAIMQGNWDLTKNTLNNYLTSVGIGRNARYFYYFNRFVNSGPTQPTRRGGSGKDGVEFDSSLRCNTVALSVASNLIVDGNTFFGPASGSGFTGYLWSKAGGGTTGFIWINSGIVTIPANSPVTFYDMMGSSLQGDGITQLRPGTAPILLTSTSEPAAVQTALSSLAVNTAGIDAIPVAFMSGAPSGSVLASTQYKILLSGRDCDSDGQSLAAGSAAVELKIDGNLISPAPTGVGLYTYTTPTTGTHTLSLRVKDDEGAFSNAVTSTFTITAPPAAPSITSWSSAAVHARGVGEAALVIPDNGTFSEPRGGGVSTLLVQFSTAINPATLTPASVKVAGNNVSNQSISLSGVAISTSFRSSNTIGVITFTPALPDYARYLVRLSGITGPTGVSLTGDADRVFTSLAGDATGDRRVNNTDAGAVESLRNTDPISATVTNQVRSDVTRDGRINNTDVGAVESVRNRDARFITDPTIP